MGEEPQADCVQIQVNGEARQVGAGLTIIELLGELNIRSDRVAVEINLEIVDRNDFEQRSLRDGDRVEVISFIGGGKVDESDNPG